MHIIAGLEAEQMLRLFNCRPQIYCSGMQVKFSFLHNLISRIWFLFLWVFQYLGNYAGSHNLDRSFNWLTPQRDHIYSFCRMFFNHMMFCVKKRRCKVTLIFVVGVQSKKTSLVLSGFIFHIISSWRGDLEFLAVLMRVFELFSVSHLFLVPLIIHKRLPLVLYPPDHWGC
jgi:hypothetical protein